MSNKRVKVISDPFRDGRKLILLKVTSKDMTEEQKAKLKDVRGPGNTYFSWGGNHLGAYTAPHHDDLEGFANAFAMLVDANPKADNAKVSAAAKPGNLGDVLASLGMDPAKVLKAQA